MIIAQDILTFWFERSSPKDWFAKSDAYDASIRQNFENCVMELASDMIEHTPHDWEPAPLPGGWRFELVRRRQDDRGPIERTPIQNLHLLGRLCRTLGGRLIASKYSHDPAYGLLIEQ